MKLASTSNALLLVAALLLLGGRQPALGGSATWGANPATNEWNVATNWMPNTIPNGAADIATFASSTDTAISLVGDIDVSEIAFSGSSGDSFTIAVDDQSLLTIDGVGIVNHSGKLQTISGSFANFYASAIQLLNDATAGDHLTYYTLVGAALFFNNSSTAGKATFDITGVEFGQGHLLFLDNTTAAQSTINITGFADATFDFTSTAADAHFTVDGGAVSFSTNSTADHAIINCSDGGGTEFTGFATAANARIAAEGANASDGFGCYIDLSDSSTAGDARFTIDGGSVQDAPGTTMRFFENATADNATITVNGGTNGGEGAALVFHSNSNGGTAMVKLSGNGRIDISDDTLASVTIGSLQGNGLVFLGGRNLSIGGNNRSTLFSGVIQDSRLKGKTGGSLNKIGSGRLILSGASTYTGGTTLSAGTLTIQNPASSATGTGKVQVNGGNLTGAGVIAGATTIGSGSGSGASLAPGLMTKSPTTLTTQSSLTFNSDGTLQERLLTQQSKADSVIANGVAINSGAQFTLQAIGRNKLPSGSVITLIKNISSNPISGTFANLADGAVLNMGRNKLQASYEGGDGNDLALTVMP